MNRRNFMQGAAASLGISIPHAPQVRIEAPTIKSVTLTDGKLEVVKETIVSVIHTGFGEFPIKPSMHVWKDIYGVVNGQIALVETVKAKIIPAQQERIEWPK